MCVVGGEKKKQHTFHFYDRKHCANIRGQDLGSDPTGLVSLTIISTEMNEN